MRSPEVLQVVDDTEVRWFGQHTFARRRGGPAVQIGRHGLAILDLFREPRSLQEVLDTLVRRAHTVIGIAEIMSVITQLQRVAVLMSPEDARERSAALGFATPAAHIRMLDDRVRTGAFLEAIERTVKPGDVVVDIGTGTGVLAIAAARAGARRVYAIEATAIGDYAAAMFAASGYGDCISLIRGWSTDITLDERADVLVSETLGDDPWDEGFVHLIVDARRRLLVAQPRIIPHRVRQVAQPVAVPASRCRQMRFTAGAVEEWTEWYGVDFAPLLHDDHFRGAGTRVSATTAANWPRPCGPLALAEFDARSASAAPRTGEGQTIIQDAGVVDGVVLSWEADLATRVRLSTSPRADGSVTSWTSQLLLARESRRVEPGDTLDVSIVFARSPELALRVAPAPVPSPSRRE